MIVRDPGTRRRLRELYTPHSDWYTAATAGRAMLGGVRPAPSPARLRMLLAADEFARGFDPVPVDLVVCAELAALAIVDAGLERPSIVGGASVYPFVQNLLLALRAEELGAAFTTLLTPAEDAVRELLAIPPGVAFAGHISVGHRRDPRPRRLSRQPVADLAFAERYGRVWPGS